MVQRLYARDTAAENRVCCRNITFQVTSGCNLRCSYCYEHHKSVERMSIETGRKVVDYILDLYEKTSSELSSSIRLATNTGDAKSERC